MQTGAGHMRLLQSLLQSLAQRTLCTAIERTPFFEGWHPARASGINFSRYFQTSDLVNIHLYGRTENKSGSVFSLEWLLSPNLGR